MTERRKGAAWEPPQSGTSAKRSAKGGANASIGRRPHSDICVIRACRP